MAKHSVFKKWSFLFSIAILLLFGAYSAAAEGMYPLPGTVNKGAVNLRTEPSTKSNKIDTLSKNWEIVVTDEVIGSNGEKWYHILDFGRDGYVRADLITVSQNEYGERIPLAQTQTALEPARPVAFASPEQIPSDKSSSFDMTFETYRGNVMRELKKSFNGDVLRCTEITYLGNNTWTFAIENIYNEYPYTTVTYEIIDPKKKTAVINARVEDGNSTFDELVEGARFAYNGGTAIDYESITSNSSNIYGQLHDIFDAVVYGVDQTTFLRNMSVPDFNKIYASGYADGFAYGYNVGNFKYGEGSGFPRTANGRYEYCFCVGYNWADITIRRIGDLYVPEVVLYAEPDSIPAVAPTEAPVMQPEIVKDYDECPRESPLKLGETMVCVTTIDGVPFNAAMTFSRIIRGNEAAQMVRNGNEFNAQAPAGKEYVIAEFQIEVQGDNASAVYSEGSYNFSVVTADGQVLNDDPFLAGINDVLSLVSGGKGTLQVPRLLDINDTDSYLLFFNHVWISLKQ